MYIRMWERHNAGFGYGKCARCGEHGKLTIDHFIPKCCKMNVNSCGNYVGICEKCNHEKGNRIVTPDWYLYLSDERKENLKRYMRYAGSYIRQNTDDPEVIAYLDRIIDEYKKQQLFEKI